MDRRRRSSFVLVFGIAIAMVAASGSVASARTPATTPNPVADGFQPRSVAFWDATDGLVAGTVVCSTCARHRTAAISMTSDGGSTWGAPVTFQPAIATDLTVVPGTTDAWATVGTRLQRTTDGGTTWSLLPDSDVFGVSFADAMNGWAVKRHAHTMSTLATTSDGGTTWTAGPTPCRHGASAVIFVARPTIDHGWVVCAGSAAAGSLVQVVWKTADGGTTWTRGFHGVAPGPLGYVFLDGGHGWRWHYNFSDLFRTVDGGTTWHDLGPVVSQNVLVVDLWFTSDTDGRAIVLRPNGASRLIGTSNGGDDWSGVVGFPTG